MRGISLADTAPFAGKQAHTMTAAIRWLCARRRWRGCPEIARLILAEGRGSWLACDLPRSGSESCECDISDTPRRLVVGLLRNPSSTSQLLRPPGRSGAAVHSKLAEHPELRTTPNWLRSYTECGHPQVAGLSQAAAYY